MAKRSMVRQRILCAWCCVVAILFAVPANAEPVQWAVVPNDSRIDFSGEYAGNTFKGSFQTWQADITFDASDLAHSKATVTVDLASARTGDATYDKTLPTADWFDIAHGANATFETGAFRAKGGNAFEADATLSIRGAKVPVLFTFNFTAEGDTARLSGTTTLKRLDFGIGKGSDGDGSWVALGIPVEVRAVMKRKP